MASLTLQVKWDRRAPVRLLRVTLMSGNRVLFYTGPSLKGRTFNVNGRKWLWRNRYA